MIGKIGPNFILFSIDHIGAILAIVIILFGLYMIRRKKVKFNERKFAHIFALSLLVVEWSYYAWLYLTGQWAVRHSLPLELCSLSLYASIVLLWTNRLWLYPFVFFAGIGGALQALITPDLAYGFPHFRYFQFFYVHGSIIFIGLYFTWIKGERPTLRKLIKTFFILNIVAAFVYIVNLLVDGNYMFLRTKPGKGSLLDYLGPYPFYLLSLELVAFVIFLILWLIFKRGKRPLK